MVHEKICKEEAELQMRDRRSQGVFSQYMNDGINLGYIDKGIVLRTSQLCCHVDLYIKKSCPVPSPPFCQILNTGKIFLVPPHEYTARGIGSILMLHTLSMGV